MERAPTAKFDVMSCVDAAIARSIRPLFVHACIHALATTTAVAAASSSSSVCLPLPCRPHDLGFGANGEGHFIHLHSSEAFIHKKSGLEDRTIGIDYLIKQPLSLRVSPNFKRSSPPVKNSNPQARIGLAWREWPEERLPIPSALLHSPHSTPVSEQSHSLLVLGAYLALKTSLCSRTKKDGDLQCSST